MKRLSLYTPLLFGLMVFMAASAPTATAQRVERSFDIAAGNTLFLDLETGGTITILGWDADQVSVIAHLRGREAEDVELDFRERSGGLVITTEHISSRRSRRSRNTSIDFEINVPRRFNVEVESMGGDVEISNVEGTFEGRTMGGELDLSGLRGEVDLTTMGGTIWVRDSELDGSVHTMGGAVRIEDVVGNLKGSSMGGEVSYLNHKRSATSASSGDEVRISTMGGAIDVDAAMAGADVHTMGGDIFIHEAARHVKARTMGGEIIIDAIDGWVEATTMGGDVIVHMIGDPATGDRHVELKSMGGDIELTVPAGLSMELDLEVAYTRNSDRDYRIISDFELVQEETDRWDNDEGSPRKYIYGTGTVRGGDHRIRIKTVNGNIILRRSN